MKNKFGWKGKAKQARTILESSLITLGNEAKNHFVGSFRLQGFEDRTVEKWPDRKKKDKRAGRAILVKTGDLRRSIRRETLSKAKLEVVIATDLPYAKIHNEGGDGMAWGKHPFKMPKRQFIGHSFKLNQRVKKIITNRLDKLFK